MARQAQELAELAIRLFSLGIPGLQSSLGKTPGADYRPSPSLAVHDAETLMRLARSYQRLQETACNRELTPRERAREKSLERRLTEEAKARGLGITFSGDPRGFVVKLQFPDGASNTWGQDGLGIG